MGYIISDGIVYSGRSGGGGGGGHTILNDSGTGLTQRDDLQFKGAYSEDDSTNEKTVINVARTMTLAEFEELSSAEKTGFINVKDETSGSDDKFQPVIYSEEEREVGVWTDGRPVYAIVLTTSVAKSITTSSWTRMEFTTPIPTNIKEMVRMSFACNTQPNFYEGFRLSWDIDNQYFKMSCEHNGTFPANIAIYIEYTKTTDTPGSGTWTPQGVPAVHYSTDEQVIGTWIDGSTLYQKTYSYSISSETSQEITVLDSNIVVKEIKGVIHNNGNDMTIPWIDASFFYNIYSSPAHKLTAIKKNTGDWTGQVVEVTIRYTKAST